MHCPVDVDGHAHAAEWEPRKGKEGRYCSYCGSVSVEDVLRLLTTKGTYFSGSDWKYGWPHKFYIGDSCKFYSAHLKDATAAQRREWNDAAKTTVGVFFDKDENGLKWKAPHGTAQAHGTVGVSQEWLGGR